MKRGGGPSLLLFLLATLTYAGQAGAQDTDACIDASERAVTLRKAGKLIDARASLSTCAASSCPEVVRASCRQRLAETTEAIPSIVFLAKDGAGGDLTAVRLTIDGATNARYLGGGAIALDPGEHSFRFEAEGQRPVVKQFVLLQGAQNRREQIVIGAPFPLAGAGATQDGPARDASTVRTLGLVVGGVGLAGLAVGGLFGALSIAAHNDYERSCGATIGAPPDKCVGAGVSGEADAATKGSVATVAFIGGGLGTVAGLVLFLVARGAGGTGRARVGVGPGSVVLSGEF